MRCSHNKEPRTWYHGIDTVLFYPCLLVPCCVCTGQFVDITPRCDKRSLRCRRRCGITPRFDGKNDRPRPRRRAVAANIAPRAGRTGSRSARIAVCSGVRGGRRRLRLSWRRVVRYGFASRSTTRCNACWRKGRNPLRRLVFRRKSSGLRAAYHAGRHVGTDLWHRRGRHAVQGSRHRGRQDPDGGLGRGGARRHVEWTRHRVFGREHVDEEMSF